MATAYSTASATAIAEAIDGRLWFFPENPNGWSPESSAKDPTSWYTVNFGRSRTIGSVNLFFFSDGSKYLTPSSYRVQCQIDGNWQDIPRQKHSPELPLANGENSVTFPAVTTQAIRLTLTNPSPPASVRLIEIKAFAP
jgi:hypothetical protein